MRTEKLSWDGPSQWLIDFQLSSFNGPFIWIINPYHGISIIQQWADTLVSMLCRPYFFTFFLLHHFMFCVELKVALFHIKASPSPFNFHQRTDDDYNKKKIPSAYHTRMMGMGMKIGYALVVGVWEKEWKEFNSHPPPTSIKKCWNKKLE